MSQKVPWLIIRCKFKDETGPATHTDQHYTDLFTTSDLESLACFWQDMSFGQLDFSGSQVTAWLVLDKNRSDYTGSGANQQGRRELVDWAKNAATKSGLDISKFYGVVIATHSDTDLFGSAARYAVCGPNHAPASILQEVGHALGLSNHSRSVADPQDYKNPFCIMSSMDFGGHNPTFNGRFGASGPGLCAPYIFKAGWLSWRIAKIPTNGRSPNKTTLTLSPLSEQQPNHKQVATIQLNSPQEVTYFVEYRFGGWDRGLAQSAVVIHQFRPDGFAYYAGSIATETTIDGSGNTQLPGRDYLDTQYNLSVRLLTNFPSDRVQIQIGPAAAVQTLSVRQVARSTLGLAHGFSVKGQVLSGSNSLRDRLIELLS